MSSSLQTPVAFIIFKRPDTTQRVFDMIRQAKPPKLLVVADGARPHVSDEAEKCAATRAIIQQVDWDCEVLTNYSEVNLGCKQRVSSGIDWVFEQVEAAIILEDDCLPHLSFFRFCEELLQRYRHDPRIAVISGQNLQFGRKRTAYSYYFSRYNHCWGWASWRRAWQYNDVSMALWNEVRSQGFLKDLLWNDRAVKYWTNFFQSVYDNQIDTWDVQWTFACWIHNGLTILPEVNLVSNIGFGTAGATNTFEESRHANLPTDAISFPLNHPPFMIRDEVADHFTQNTVYDLDWQGRVQRKLNKFSKLLGF